MAGKRRIALIFISFILTSTWAVAQASSARKAGEIVRQSLSTHGSMAAIEASGGFQVQLNGIYDLGTRLQGRSASRPEPTDISEQIVYDQGTERVSYTADLFNYYSSNQNYREITDDQRRMIYIDILNANGGWVPIEMVPDMRERNRRVLPSVLLSEALAHPESLNLEGEDDDSNVFGFTTSAGDRIRLYINKESHLLQKAESQIDMPLLGVTTMSWHWSDYSTQDSGATVPGHLQVKLGEKVLKDVSMDVAFGVFPDAFDPPKGVEIGDPPEELMLLSEFVPYGQRSPEVEELLPGVYMLNSLRPGFALLFVEFDEHMVAVDAPTGWYEMNQIPPMNWSHGDDVDALGVKYLKAIEQTIPGKPVRYLVLTHHHSDHIGGLKPFADAGVTIITGENAALMARDVAPQSNVEIVKGEHTITDGNMAMQLIELPDDNPKADNYLMVYLPNEKLLYATGFIYPIPEAVFPPKESIPLSQYFVEWLDGSGLEVEHNYNIHGMNKVEDWQLDAIRKMSP